MFNKLKNVAVKFGNSSQREKFKEEAIQEADDELVMAIETIKLELTRGRAIRSYINNSVDNEKYPSYQLRQARLGNFKMNDDEKKEKIEWLESQGIKTEYENEGKTIFFTKIEEEAGEGENKDEK